MQLLLVFWFLVSNDVGATDQEKYSTFLGAFTTATCFVHNAMVVPHETKLG